jgi:UDP-glucose 4-epimerase
MHYLVTGGAGFIGSHLVDALVAGGSSVTVLDDLSTGRLENLAHARRTGSVEFVEGTTSDPECVDDLMSRADVCFHLASAVGVRLIVEHAYESLLKNVRGADIVLHAAARHGVRAIFASTSEIYGKYSEGALSEDSDRLLGPPQLSRWSYATAKCFGESLAFGLHSELGAETIVVRFFNTTGPRQSGAYGMVLPTFVRQAVASEDVTVYGNGAQTRCFAHVRDAVRALMLLHRKDEAVGNVFNVGAGIELSIVELAQRVIRRAGSDSEIVFVPFDEAYGDGFEELGRRRPDTTALISLTGWRPEFTVDDAIDDVIAYLRAGAGAVETTIVAHNGNGQANAPVPGPLRSLEQLS